MAYTFRVRGAAVCAGIQVIDATDDTAEHPTSRRIGVEDFRAIVYHALGLRIDDAIADLSGRPTHLVPGGEVPVELL